MRLFTTNETIKLQEQRKNSQMHNEYIEKLLILLDNKMKQFYNVNIQFIFQVA